MSEIPILLSLVFFIITFTIGIYLFISKQLAGIGVKEKSENRGNSSRFLNYAFYGFATATILPLTFFAVNNFSSQKRVVQHDAPSPPISMPTPSPTFTKTTNPSGQSSWILAFTGILAAASFKWFKPGSAIKDNPINTTLYIVFTIIISYIIARVVLAILGLISFLIILLSLGYGA